MHLQTLMISAVQQAELHPDAGSKKDLIEAIEAFKAKGGAGDNLAYAESALRNMDYLE